MFRSLVFKLSAKALSLVGITSDPNKELETKNNGVEDRASELIQQRLYGEQQTSVACPTVAVKSDAHIWTLEELRALPLGSRVEHSIYGMGTVVKNNIPGQGNTGIAFEPGKATVAARTAYFTFETTSAPPWNQAMELVSAEHYNPKNLPVVLFHEKEGHVLNGHELMKGIPYEFAHRRLRKTRAWVRKQDAVYILSMSNFRYWGEVGLVEEQRPYYNGNEIGWTNGWIEPVEGTQTESMPSNCWTAQDKETLEPLL